MPGPSGVIACAFSPRNRPSGYLRQRLRRGACEMHGAMQGVAEWLHETRFRCFAKLRLEERRAAADERQPRGAGGDEPGGERVDMAGGQG